MSGAPSPHKPPDYGGTAEDRQRDTVSPAKQAAQKQHSELPPVSREALEANLRSTHANLDFCIERRRRLEEQLEAAHATIQVLRYMLDTAEDADKSSLTDSMLAYLTSNPASDYEQASLDTFGADSSPASRPLDPKFPNHVEGCICPRFKDIAPDLIADLTCPVHGVNGTHPGDVLSERSPASSPTVTNDVARDS